MPGESTRPLIAHMVYFTLKDPSGAAQQKLVDDCHRYLKVAPGIVYFAAGMRVAVIERGRTIAVGTADELKRQVGGERIELTLARDADAALATRTLEPHVDGAIRVDGDSRRLSGAAVDGTRRLADLVRDFDAAGIGLDDLAVRRPTLDDVFLRLTGHAAEEREEELA